jgi:thiamine-phosphate pyrophosphorylase
MITGARDEDSEVSEVCAAVRDGVNGVQIRRKQASGRELERLVSRVIAALSGTSARIFVNDRLDVALATGAAGVHLPEDGIPVEHARNIAPSEFEIGASVHSLESAIRADEAGADFVVFGPVFPTSSKPGHPGVGLERLREVSSGVRIPVLALGGVEPERVRATMQAGASGVAGISVFANERERKRLLASIEGVRTLHREVKS